MTTEPTTQSGREPWRCLDCRQAPTGVCTWHAAYDAGVWAARAALLDELEAAVRELPIVNDGDCVKHYGNLTYSCSCEVSVAAVTALMQRHREPVA